MSKPTTDRRKLTRHEYLAFRQGYVSSRGLENTFRASPMFVLGHQVAMSLKRGDIDDLLRAEGYEPPHLKGEGMSSYCPPPPDRPDEYRAWVEEKRRYLLPDYTD